jgi:50S ribosome-binding GTPase/Domain of unknown function (DUF3482)
MTSDPKSIALSLVSHTNAGKTTLARTLLGRDVGLVRDAPHVTEFADVFTLLQTPQGEQLKLWDTPGFGDSVRLVKRLQASGHPLLNPLGWFMSEVWDRWRDRAFWASQQAMRNVRDEADVLLYLVNASESPEGAGYVQPEMELLGWTGKPVIVLLNQLGAPREGRLEAQEIALWQTHLARFKHVKTVLPLDAFARCWVQEGTLLQEIENVLPVERQAMMARLRGAWQADKLRTFEAAMKSLANSVARLATATQALSEAGGVRARLKQLGASVGLGLGVGSVDQTPSAVAQRALAEQLDLEVRANTLELIQLHGLEGKAQGEILTRLATHFELRLRMDEGKAALWGGMVSGALVGLKADILSGGLTLGGGLLAGGLIGALGAAGLARCVNLVRGTQQSWVMWNAEALDQMVEAALLRYLAVAHFGRGRGEWAQGESPSHWREATQLAMQPYREGLNTVWRERDAARDEMAEESQVLIAASLLTVLTQASSDVLRGLYPQMEVLGESAHSELLASQ